MNDDLESDSTYEYLRGIAIGGNGKVELVRHKITQKLYARKIIHTLEGNIEKVREEINLQKRVIHPNVVKIIDFWESVIINSIYLTIIMEYTEKKDLCVYMNSILKEGKWFTENEILKMMIQISQGLNCIHQQNIAHLDIKPSNILVFEDNILKITDFGISKAIPTEKSINATRWTHSYAPPEYFEGRKFLLEPDIWALGCVFYELCTNKLAYSGWYDANQTLNTELLKNYSPKILHLICDMLKRDIKQRPKIISVLDELINLQTVNLQGNTRKGIQKINLTSLYFEGDNNSHLYEDNSILEISNSKERENKSSNNINNLSMQKEINKDNDIIDPIPVTSSRELLPNKSPQLTHTDKTRMDGQTVVEVARPTNISQDESRGEQISPKSQHLDQINLEFNDSARNTSGLDIQHKDEDISLNTNVILKEDMINMENNNITVLNCKYKNCKFKGTADELIDHLYTGTYT